MAGMSDAPQADPLDQLVRAITDEVLARLAACNAAPAGEFAEVALIDHTLLKPDATRSQIGILCREAVRFGFASVCVNPCYVPLAAELTHGSGVRVCTVISFPLGAALTSVKMVEA
jgi:deoxyribose-phosphate aldolase